MDAVELALRAMGAFYVFAGYVATRAALTSHLIDRALAAISAAKPAPVETAQSLWLLGAANLILLGGAALVLLLDAAAWIFVASALGQAAYLFVVAPVYFDASDPPDPNGRRQSTNAFVVYAAATVFVIWAAAVGRLARWQEMPWQILAIAAAAAASHLAYTIWMFAKPLTSDETSGGSP